VDRHHSNYDAFTALHEARMQQVRASAVAAGLERRDRSPGLMRRIADWLAHRPRHRPAPTSGSVERFFWS
jgi:hypothetical protein